MKTLQLTQAQAGVAYNVLRDALDEAYATAQDIANFPDEFDAEDAKSAEEEIATLEALLEQLV